jgi:hypothetical protein
MTSVIGEVCAFVKQHRAKLKPAKLVILTTRRRIFFGDWLFDRRFPALRLRGGKVAEWK